MGPTPSSDFYQVQSRENLQLRDTRVARYIWYDPNIFNLQNRAHALKFKDYEVDLFEADSQNKFNKEVERWPHTQRIRVVCAASLPQEAYERIQKCEKIDRVIVFCRWKVKADMLINTYSKIKAACFSSCEVARIIKLWDKEEETSLLIFEEDNIDNINKYYSNVLAMTDRQNILMAKQTKEQFELYVQKIMGNQKKQISQIIQQYQRSMTSKQTLVLFLQKYMIGSSKLLNMLNQQLICTFNPKKLAYLRYIINDTFHGIKWAYSTMQLLPTRKYYSVVALNQAELNKLAKIEQKYIMFTYFLQAATSPFEYPLLSHEVQLIIDIPPKQITNFSHGYLQSQNSIVFNLGTYFKVNQYNSFKQTLTIAVLQMPDNIELNLKSDDHRICLNRIYQESQHRKYQGQWYSLLLNHFEQAASEYVTQKMKALSRRQNENGRVLRYQMSIIGRKLRNNVQNDYQNILAELERNKSDYQLLEYSCMGCEIYLNNQRLDKFQQIYRRIPQNLTINIDLQRRLSLLTFAYDLHFSGEAQLVRIMDDFDKFQQSLGKDPDCLSYEFYHLLLKVKLKGYMQLKKIAEALKILDVLMSIYCICQGRASTDYIRLSHIKKQLEEAKNRQFFKKQIERKRQLFQSSIHLDSLRKQNYNVDIGYIDLNFYQ